MTGRISGQLALAGFNLGNAHQQQGEPAEQDMRANALILGMIYRA